jgi:hypothetical protein
MKGSAPNPRYAESLGGPPQCQVGRAVRVYSTIWRDPSRHILQQSIEASIVDRNRCFPSSLSVFSASLEPGSVKISALPSALCGKVGKDCLFSPILASRELIDAPVVDLPVRLGTVSGRPSRVAGPSRAPRVALCGKTSLRKLGQSRRIHEGQPFGCEAVVVHDSRTCPHSDFFQQDYA